MSTNIIQRSLQLALALSLFSAVSLATATSPMPVSAAGSNKQVLNIQQWKTTQGVPVYFVQTPELPMVDVDVVFDAGSARDGKKPGLARLTASLLDEGAGKWNADQIAERFDDIGASYNINVNQDMTVIGFRGLTDQKKLANVLETFSTVLTAPTFAADSFSRLQRQILISLEQMRQSPGGLARRAFVKAIYGTQPYAHLTMGTQKSIASLTPADVKAFYDTYYVAKNARVVIVGDLKLDMAKKVAEQIVGSLALGEAVKPIAEMVPPSKPVHENVNFPAQQTTIIMGQLGVRPAHPDYFPLMVGNHILGGGGLVSRLFDEVREKRGLVYTVRSQFSSLAARGTFFIFLQTRKEEAANAIDLTKRILTQFVTKGPTKKELEAAKKNIIGGFPLQVSSNGSILEQVVYLTFYGLPSDFLDRYRENVEKVTSADIKAAFQKHIQPDNMSVITVGDGAVTSPSHATKKTG